MNPKRRARQERALERREAERNLLEISGTALDYVETEAQRAAKIKTAEADIANLRTRLGR